MVPAKCPIHENSSFIENGKVLFGRHQVLETRHDNKKHSSGAYIVCRDQMKTVVQKLVILLRQDANNAKQPHQPELLLRKNMIQQQYE